MADDQTNPLNNLPQDNPPAGPQDPAGTVPPVPQDSGAPDAGAGDSQGALNVEHGAAPSEPDAPAAPETPVPEEPTTPAPGGDDASGDQNSNQAL